MEEANAELLLNDDACMPVQSTNPITQMGGDDGHLEMGSNLLSLGSTYDIHTSKKKNMKASSVDSVLVLLPGILQFPLQSHATSPHTTIGRLEGFRPKDTTNAAARNNLTLTLGGNKDTTNRENSSKSTNDDDDDDDNNDSKLYSEPPKIVLRGRAIPSKTTFVLLHVTAASSTKSTKKQLPPKVTCKGVFRNVLVFGEGTVTGHPKDGIGETSDRPWRHYGASERCENHIPSTPSILASKTKHDSFIHTSIHSAGIGATDDCVPMPETPADADDRPMNGQRSTFESKSIVDRDCIVEKPVSKSLHQEQVRRQPARQNKQPRSYTDMDDDASNDADPPMTKKVRLESAKMSRCERGQQNSFTTTSLEDVVIIDTSTMEAEDLQIVPSKVKRSPRTQQQGMHTENISIATDVAQNEEVIIMDTKRPSESMKDVIILDSKRTSVASNQPPSTSVPSTPSDVRKINASSPGSSSKKRRRRPITSPPPKTNAHILTIDEDDEFAFLGD